MKIKNFFVAIFAIAFIATIIRWGLIAATQQKKAYAVEKSSSSYIEMLDEIDNSAN